MRLRALSVAAVAAMAGSVYAQQIISARSGAVHYVEGQVTVAGQPVHQKFGEFPTLRAGEELQTQDGRAEVLLTPGAFLRVADHSSVRMISSDLSDTRVEILTGSAILECDELLKDNAITLVYKGTNIQVAKHGLYRVDTNPPQVRVYDGEALVEAESGPIRLKRGKQASLQGVVVAEKFDAKRGDQFDMWSMNRSDELTVASVRAAKSLKDSRAAWSGGWAFSPLDGLYTFVPGSGIAYNPFGWGYWSPGMAPYYYAYYGAPPFYGMYGYGMYGYGGYGVYPGGGVYAGGAGATGGVSKSGHNTWTPPGAPGRTPGASGPIAGARGAGSFRLPVGGAAMRSGGFGGARTGGFGGGGFSGVRGGGATGGASMGGGRPAGGFGGGRAAGGFSGGRAGGGGRGR